MNYVFTHNFNHNFLNFPGQKGILNQEATRYTNLGSHIQCLHVSCGSSNRTNKTTFSHQASRQEDPHKEMTRLTPTLTQMQSTQCAPHESSRPAYQPAPAGPSSSGSAPHLGSSTWLAKAKNECACAAHGIFCLPRLTRARSPSTRASAASRVSEEGRDELGWPRDLYS